VKLETLLELELMATSQETPLAAANPETLLAIRLLLQLQESQLAEATQLLPEMVRLKVAGWPSLEDLDLCQIEQGLLRERPPAAWARLRDLQLRRAADFPLALARARQCLPGPGPCAFSREIPVAGKCNRAARCGGRPIFARYRRLRNRRAPVDYGNRCSRWRRKHARPGRPFQIAALDKYRCLPRRIAD
jgi:hypothetical protein